MATKHYATDASAAIQQRINSGQFFNGTLPTGNSTFGTAPASPIYKYTAQNAGGLFYWDNNEPVLCTQINVDLGASANISLYIVNLDPASVQAGAPTVVAGESVLIAQATAVALLNLDHAHFQATLLPFQGLQLVTTASGAAPIARIVCVLERALYQ